MDHPRRWKESYSIKIAEMDHQHKRFFRIAAQLDFAYRRGRADFVVNEILQSLIEHMLDHFAAEEYLMYRHGFPKLIAHRHEHDMLAQKLARFNLSHGAGKSSIPSSLLAFLQSELMLHTLTTDNEYKAFLNAGA